ncbi:RBM19 [Cordylochernes scorpioides]|uniref:RBM19 n=1 Tax=Cordylochernes scorpioides TaxID=51811 RepID=A0ABY6L2Z1_9ARAC|nr:RBM19 [Cordylochernes scorpioides]
MSRLLVKNLPKVTEEDVKKFFAPHGTITDLKLLYKEDGTFRNLAHVGYSSESQAQAALSSLNNTYVKGNKIQVVLWEESAVKSSVSVEKRMKKGKVKDQTEKLKKLAEKNYDNLNTVKLRNLPLKCKKSQLRAFFNPLKPLSIRIPSKKQCFAFVKLKDRKDFRKALKKDKDIMEGRQIRVLEYSDKSTPAESASHGGDSKVDLELLMKSGRLFVRNLGYDTSEEHLHELFSKYEPIQELNLIRNPKDNKCKGFAYVTLAPDQALRAYTDLDRNIFQGRILHLLPSEPADKPKKEDKVAGQAKSSYKKEKLKTLREEATQSHNWNTLFFSTEALMGILKQRDVESDTILKPAKGEAPAVLLALAEVSLVDKMKKFFVKNGINFENSVSPSLERSDNIIIVKNLPADTNAFELKSRFDIHGPIKRFLTPDNHCILAIVEYEHPHHAQKAFKNEAYAEFHKSPLFLEWAPQNIFKTPEELKKEEEENSKMEVDNQPSAGSTLYIKNINFQTKEEDLEKHFAKVGKILRTTIARNKVNNLSNGYGFMEFADPEAAESAIKTHQFTDLHDHRLELSRAKQNSKKPRKMVERETQDEMPESNKLLVRNVAFQANKTELTKLFQSFGELNYVRLPRKKTGTGSHRGFAFVEFKEQQHAARAFNKLKDSTHFYGRRLVIEWAKPEEKDENVET